MVDILPQRAADGLLQQFGCFMCIIAGAAYLYPISLIELKVSGDLNSFLWINIPAM